MKWSTIKFQKLSNSSTVKYSYLPTHNISLNISKSSHGWLLVIIACLHCFCKKILNEKQQRVALEICKRKAQCCSGMKPHGTLLKRLCYPGPVSALWEFLSSLILLQIHSMQSPPSTNIRLGFLLYQIFGIRPSFTVVKWLLFVFGKGGGLLARAETMIELQLSMPLVVQRWNCHTCNQRLKFSTELCVLFI